MVLRYRQRRKELSGGEPNTSCNQMHIEAALQGPASDSPTLAGIHLYYHLELPALRIATSWGTLATKGWRTDDHKPVRFKERWETLVATQGLYQVNYYLLDSQSLPESMKQAQKLARQAAPKSMKLPGKTTGKGTKRCG